MGLPGLLPLDQPRRAREQPRLGRRVRVVGQEVLPEEGAQGGLQLLVAPPGGRHRHAARRAHGGQPARVEGAGHRRQLAGQLRARRAGPLVPLPLRREPAAHGPLDGGAHAGPVGARGRGEGAPEKLVELLPLADRRTLQAVVLGQQLLTQGRAQDPGPGRRGPLVRTLGRDPRAGRPACHVARVDSADVVRQPARLPWLGLRLSVIYCVFCLLGLRLRLYLSLYVVLSCLIVLCLCNPFTSHCS